MKIVYHHRTTAADGGGVHIDSLIDALRDLGVEVVLVAPSISGSAAGVPRRHHWISKLRRHLPRALHELVELAYNLPEAWRLLRVVRRHVPDLIYERANLYLLAGRWVARRTGTPLISEVNSPYFRERSLHGGLALPRLAAWSERAAWLGADIVIAVTGALADIVSGVGVSRESVHVMPNGVDPRAFSSEAIDVQSKARLGLERYTVLGFTGYVREWNSLDVVIDLLATAEGQQLYLLVVGDGPARAELEARAARTGVAERLCFTGVVSRDGVAGLISAFDIALQPAANPYASPLKLFEYMAMARAIVAPDQPNIREILQDGRDAVLFSPQDKESFAAAVVKLAADPALRARLAAGATDTVRQRDFTWRRNAERVVELAQQLVAKRSVRIVGTEQSGLEARSGS